VRVLDERWPFAHLRVYCDARIGDDPGLVTDVMMAVAGRMSGEPLPDAARPVVADMAKKEDRESFAASSPLGHQKEHRVSVVEDE